MTFNFGLVAHYINTKNNLVADTLSRLLYINSEQEVIKCFNGSGLCCVNDTLEFCRSKLAHRAE